MRAGGIS